MNTKIRDSTVTYQAQNGEIDPDRIQWMPTPELVRLDADVTLVFLSGNGVRFYEPVDDDWYRATAEGKNLTSFTNTGSRTSYQPVEAASPLACAEQWQWCNSNYRDESGCGPLGSGLDAIYGASHLFNISEDVWESGRPSSNTSTGAHAIWQILIESIGDLSVNWAIKQLKTSALTSRLSSFNGLQYALPTNQWHLDVTNWWDTMLAKTQANMVYAAIGNTDPALKDSSITPINQYEQHLCNNQVCQHYIIHRAGTLY